MTGHYEYTPYIWPIVASPALLLVPGAYAWRHRSAPGARPFVAFVLSIVPWAVGAALELAAADPATKIRWYVFQGVWQLPTATAALWFALECAGRGPWLNRSTAALLAVPPAVVLVLMPTSSRHEVLCSAFTIQGEVPCLVDLLTQRAVVFSSQSERVDV